MKRIRYVLFITILCIIVGLILRIIYIPEKPCDSSTDLDEICDYIADYIADYMDNDIPNDNNKLKEMVESITVVTVYPQRNEVEVQMLDCTFGKKQLFRREIINSKYIKFVDCKSGVMNH